jgi:hypothetical protein
MMRKIMREEPETEPSSKQEQHIDGKRFDVWSYNEQSKTR